MLLTRFDDRSKDIALRIEAFDLRHLEQLVRALRQADKTGRYTEAFALASWGKPPALTAGERRALSRLLASYRANDAPTFLVTRIELELERSAFLERLDDPKQWAWITPRFALRARLALKPQADSVLSWFIEPHNRTDTHAYVTYRASDEGTVPDPRKSLATRVATDAMRALLGHEKFAVDGELAMGPEEHDRTAALGTNFVSPRALSNANRVLAAAFPKRAERLLSEWRRTAAASTSRGLDMLSVLDDEADRLRWVAEIERTSTASFARVVRAARQTLDRIVRFRQRAAAHGHGVFVFDGPGD